MTIELSMKHSVEINQFLEPLSYLSHHIEMDDGVDSDVLLREGITYVTTSVTLELSVLHTL